MLVTDEVPETWFRCHERPCSIEDEADDTSIVDEPAPNGSPTSYVSEKDNIMTGLKAEPPI